MPSKPHVRRRRTHNSQVRERLLDAARALFALEGPAAVTMRRIGERCDYTPSAIYKHFPNKEALLDELRRDALSRLALEVTEGFQEVAARFGGPLAALREGARRYLAFAAAQRSSYVLAFSPEPGGMDPSPIIAAFAELLARARRSPGGESTQIDRDLALVFWHALHGRAMAPPGITPDDETFVDLCLATLPLSMPAPQEEL